MDPEPKEKELFFGQSDFAFQPRLDFLTINVRRVRAILFWLLALVLLLIGVYGVFGLVFYYSFFGLEKVKEFSDTFYFSLLADMLFLYIWQRRKEKVLKIGSGHFEPPIEVSNFLDDSLRRSLEKAWLFCYRKGYHFLRPVHLFYALVQRKDFKKVIKRLNTKPELIIQKTVNVLKSSSFFPESEKGMDILGPRVASDFKKIFVDAYNLCVKEKRTQISPLDVLYVFSQEENLVGLIFDEFGIEPEEIKRAAVWAILEKNIREQESSFSWKLIFKPTGKFDRAMTASLTPMLDKMSRDLTALARRDKFELVLGREKEIDDVFNFFAGGQTGVILTGEDSVGKKAIIKKIARLMVEEDVPDFLKDKRLIQLEIPSLVGLEGAREKGEEYLKTALAEVGRAGNVVLVVENLDQIVGLKANQGGLDLSEILSLALGNKSFYFIGTASDDGYASKVNGTELSRLLNQIRIPTPSKNLVWMILISKIIILEQKLKVIFAVDALEEAINLAERYLYGKALAAKAMDLLIEAGHKKAQEKKGDRVVNDKDVAVLVSEKTSIPLEQVEEAEKEKLLNLENVIHRRLINQEEAVKAVANAMRRSRLDVKDRERPVANFLFVGPTGVGKTELAKTLAWAYFGDEKRMVRLDMSEYQEKNALRRLLGLKSGGMNEKGYLTEKIKRQPYTLLLLDELEKANKDVLNIFLQVMDEGRLTDASGETVSFSHVILIATSNAGTKFIQERVRAAAPYSEISRELKQKVLLDHFRPEFLNRFDDIVLFKPLSRENLVAITYLFLKEIKDRLEERGIIFEAEQEAAEELALAGYDPAYGARNLRRVVQDIVETPLAKLLLEENVLRRDRIVLRQGLTLEIERAMRI